MSLFDPVDLIQITGRTGRSLDLYMVQHKTMHIPDKHAAGAAFLHAFRHRGKAFLRPVGHPDRNVSEYRFLYLVFRQTFDVNGAHMCAAAVDLFKADLSDGRRPLVDRKGAAV